MKDECLIEVFNAWEEISQIPDTMLAYHSRLKAITDEQAKLHYAEQRELKR